MVLIGALIGAFGVFQVIGMYMPEIWMFGVLLSIALALSRAAFAILPAVVSTIIPYRLRSRGIALLGIYLFLFGAFVGAVLTGLLSDSVGERTALTIVVLPATLIGGALIAYGARYVREDISLVVEELTEEQHQQERLAQGDARIPVLQVRNLDFAYGKVQVLFDVAFEVHRGEVLALLGTNGAGKSTILRVVSGLGVPTRGVVRLDGRTVTYADPELRAKAGIVLLSRGQGDVRLAQRRREPAHGRLPVRQGRSRRSHRPRPGDLPAAPRPAARAGVRPVGRTAADAGAGHGAAARPRDPAHRRAVAGPVARSWSRSCSPWSSDCASVA